MSEYPVNSTGRKFLDSEGNEMTLAQMIKYEPIWTAKIILKLYEKADRLENVLISSGFQDLGGEMWKPPIGKSHGGFIQKCDELQAKVDRLEKEKEYLKTGGCYLVCAASIKGGTGCGFCANCEDEDKWLPDLADLAQCKDEQGGAG